MRTIRTKLAAMCSGVVVAGALATAPLSVHANDGDIDTFTYEGVVACVVPWVGGDCLYSISSSFGFCTSSDQFPPEAGTCTVTESGSHSSVVCGTGTWSGTRTITEPDGASESETTSAVSVAGVGIAIGASPGVFVLSPNSTQFPSGTSSVCTLGFNITSATANP